MIDTHAHLDFKNYIADRVRVIARCQEKLDFVINIGVNPRSCRDSIELAQKHKFLYSTIGIHPEEAQVWLGNLEKISFKFYQLIADKMNKVVGIGETGLDYYFGKPISDENKNVQKTVFNWQIELALKFDLPLIIHSREAFEETMNILSKCKNRSGLRGVWHSFTYGLAEAERILQMGFYLGINGIVTFPSARDLKNAVREIPLEKIVLETDSPFLATQPVRGKCCEPWMVEWVGEEVAKIKGLSKEEVFRITDENAKTLFNIKFSKYS